MLLALDTSLDATSVALFDPNSSPQVQVALSRPMRVGHAEIIFDCLDEALRKANLTPDALTKIAVCVGPGSFTGLRVALAIARSLAATAALPCVGLSSLALFADEGRSLSPALIQLAVVEARHNHAYVAAYDTEGKCLLPPCYLSYEALAAYVADKAVHLIGYEADKIAAALPASQVQLVTQRSAIHIMTLAQRGFHAAPCDFPPLPLYLKAADATVSKKPAIALRV